MRRSLQRACHGLTGGMGLAPIGGYRMSVTKEGDAMNQTMRRVLSGAAAIAAAAASGGLMTPVGAQESADAKFLMEAIQDNMAEVKIGDFAKEHADSEAARDYGKMLSTDHAK